MNNPWAAAARPVTRGHIIERALGPDALAPVAGRRKPAAGRLGNHTLGRPTVAPDRPVGSLGETLREARQKSGPNAYAMDTGMDGLLGGLLSGTGLESPARASLQEPTGPAPRSRLTSQELRPSIQAQEEPAMAPRGKRGRPLKLKALRLGQSPAFPSPAGFGPQSGTAANATSNASRASFGFGPESPALAMAKAASPARALAPLRQQAKLASRAKSLASSMASTGASMADFPATPSRRAGPAAGPVARTPKAAAVPGASGAGPAGGQHHSRGWSQGSRPSAHAEAAHSGSDDKASSASFGRPGQLHHLRHRPSITKDIPAEDGFDPPTPLATQPWEPPSILESAPGPADPSWAPAAAGARFARVAPPSSRSPGPPLSPPPALKAGRKPPHLSPAVPVVPSDASVQSAARLDAAGRSLAAAPSPAGAPGARPFARRSSPRSHLPRQAALAETRPPASDKRREPARLGKEQPAVVTETRPVLLPPSAAPVASAHPRDPAQPRQRPVSAVGTPGRPTSQARLRGSVGTSGAVNPALPGEGGRQMATSAPTSPRDRKTAAWLGGASSHSPNEPAPASSPSGSESSPEDRARPQLSRAGQSAGIDGSVASPADAVEPVHRPIGSEPMAPAETVSPASASPAMPQKALPRQAASMPAASATRLASAAASTRTEAVSGTGQAQGPGDSVASSAAGDRVDGLQPRTEKQDQPSSQSGDAENRPRGGAMAGEPAKATTTGSATTGLGSRQLDSAAPGSGALQGATALLRPGGVASAVVAAPPGAGTGAAAAEGAKALGTQLQLSVGTAPISACSAADDRSVSIADGATPPSVSKQRKTLDAKHADGGSSGTVGAGATESHTAATGTEGTDVAVTGAEGADAVAVGEATADTDATGMEGADSDATGAEGADVAATGAEGADVAATGAEGADVAATGAEGADVAATGAEGADAVAVSEATADTDATGVEGADTDGVREAKAGSGAAAAGQAGSAQCRENGSAVAPDVGATSSSAQGPPLVLPRLVIPPLLFSEAGIGAGAHEASARSHGHSDHSLSSDLEGDAFDAGSLVSNAAFRVEGVTGLWAVDHDLPELTVAPAEDEDEAHGDDDGPVDLSSPDPPSTGDSSSKPGKRRDTADSGNESEAEEADAEPPLDEDAAGGNGPWPCEACSGAGPLGCHASALRGHLRCLTALLGTDGSEFVEFDARGRSPLFYAASAGMRKCCSALVDYHSDWVSSQDSEGNTALSAACASGHTTVATVLLEAGADPSAVSSRGLTPAHVAKTPSLIHLLASYGAPLEAKDKAGRTPLFVACALGRRSAAEMLLELDTTMTLIEDQDERGDRPLLAAAANGHKHVVRLLLGHGAEWGGANHQSLIAEDVARVNGHERVFRLLRRVRLADERAARSNAQEAYAGSLLTPTPGADAPKGDLFTPARVSRLSTIGEHKQHAPAETGHAAAEGTATDSDSAALESVDWPTLVLASSGPWAAFWDPSHSAVYYVHGPTGQSQWDSPADEHGPVLAEMLASQDADQQAVSVQG